MTQLKFDHHFVAFGQQFSFLNEATLQEAKNLESECDSSREFKSLLNAEEVFYTATNCRFVEA